ncbi:MAG: hypothetical protein B6240_12200 [Desulfobacteraceae bacterium 4572_87]|nr:MAG: hypothetical protein B6240_12200 [Desulfobacteraceae bacterium 4572_87]
METAKAYEEIVDFIASGTSPASVIAFRPSSDVKASVAYLIEREKTTVLHPDEKSELDHYSQIEHLMRLAKAWAAHYAP